MTTSKNSTGFSVEEKAAMKERARELKASAIRRTRKTEKTVCFFQDTAKFKARYATLGFSDSAQLDDGATWPIRRQPKEHRGTT